MRVIGRGRLRIIDPDSYPILNYAWTNSQITSARLLNFLSEHPGRL